MRKPADLLADLNGTRMLSPEEARRELSDLLAELNGLPTPSREEVERQERVERRVKRLEPMRDVVRAEDFDALVGDTVQQTHAVKNTRMWLRAARGQVAVRGGSAPRFLVLQGEKGRGKTVAAGLVMAELGGLYVSMPDLVKLATSKHWTDADKFEAIRTAKCLVVDDVGTEACPPETSADVMWSLVNPRQGGRHYTVFTTNLAVSAFFARCGERGASRIMHQGIVVVVEGADMRRKLGGT